MIWLKAFVRGFSIKHIRSKSKSVSCFGFLFYFCWNSIHFVSVLKTSALTLEDISSRNKAAEILLAIIHCNGYYFVFCLQFFPPWEMYVHNQRLVEAGRHLRSSFCPNPLLNQGHIEPAAQLSIQVAFEYLQDRDSTASLGNLCQPTLVALHNETHSVILKAC